MIHNHLDTAISLLTLAVKERVNNDHSKAAYKAIKLVTPLVQKSEGLSDTVLSQVDALIHLDQGVTRLEGKYKGKIHAKMNALIDCQVAWAGAAQLLPNCVTLHFANKEETYTVAPPMLDRLRAHSKYLQDNWAEIQAKKELALPVSREQFLSIRNELCGVTKERSAEEALRFYQAVSILRVASLEIKALDALKASLSQQPYVNLLKLLCKIALGKIHSPNLAEAAIYVLLEQEGRLAWNRDFLHQPKAKDYIQLIVCEKNSVSYEEFKNLAKANCPAFFEYLCGIDALSTPSSQSSAIQQISFRLEALRNHQSIKEQVIELFAPELPTFIASVYIVKANGQDLIGVPACPKAEHIRDSKNASDEFIRQHPVLWFGQQRAKIKEAGANSSVREKILEEIEIFTELHGEHLTERARKLCAMLAFTCYLDLNKAQEARRYLDRFDAGDLSLCPELLFRNYYLFLCELGLKFEIHPIHQDGKAFIEFHSNFYSLNFDRSEQLRKILQGDPLRSEQSVQIVFYNGVSMTVSSTQPEVSLIEFAQNNHTNALSRILLAYVLWRKGQNDSALSYCTEALSLQKNPTMLLMRARIYAAKKDWKAAEKDFLDLLKLEFSYENRVAYVQTMQLDSESMTDLTLDDCLLKVHQFLEEGQVEKAQELLNSRSDEERATSEAIFLAAKCAFKQGRVFQALLMIDEVFKNGANPRGRYTLEALTFFMSFPLLSIRKNLHAGYVKMADELAKSTYWQEREIAPQIAYVRSLSKLFEGAEIGDTGGLLKVMEVVYKDPPEAVAEVNKLLPHLSEQDRRKASVYLAHRLGQNQAVIEQVPENDAEMRVLLADAYKRIGNLEKAKALLGEAATPAEKLVSIVVACEELIKSPEVTEQQYTEMEARLLACAGEIYAYRPLLELYHATLYSLAASAYRKQNYDWAATRQGTFVLAWLTKMKQAEQKLNQLNLVISSDTFLAMLGYDASAVAKIQNFKARGYQSDALDVVYHQMLMQESKFGLMDEETLKRLPELHSAYSTYLLFFNRFEEALPFANGWVKSLCQRYMGVEQERGIYISERQSSFTVDIHILFRDGDYTSIVDNYSNIKIVDKDIVQQKALWVLFCLAQSYAKLGQYDKAKAQIAKINKHSKKYKDHYGQAFFDQVSEWSATELRRKKQRTI